MKRRVDRAKHTKEWEVGDRVLLSTQNLWTFAAHLPSKLKRRWVGPFTIANVAGVCQVPRQDLLGSLERTHGDTHTGDQNSAKDYKLQVHNII